MTPLEMIAEWRRGCGNTIGAEPEQCEECTRALIEAIAAKLEESVIRPTAESTTWEWEIVIDDQLTEVVAWRCRHCGSRAHGAPQAECDCISREGTSPKFKLGDRVRKIKGSQWKGRVVGTYSTELTPEGYAVESDTEKGSVQIYPAAALGLV